MGAGQRRTWDLEAVRALPSEPAHDGLGVLARHRLDLDWVRRRFGDAGAQDWTPETFGDRDGLPSASRAAAVLIPIVARDDGPTVLLTQRTDHLSTHSGQIAFPGGGVESHDRDRLETALREAREEVGLDPGCVDVLGVLPEYTTGTGFAVTPVVGIVRADFCLDPDPNEVADVFEVPFAFLMDPRNHERRRFDIDGRDRTFFAMPYRAAPDAPEYFIWGATAAMIRNLYHFLAATRVRVGRAGR